MSRSKPSESTPIFITSYSGLFKSFRDVLQPNTLTGLPVVLGATGGTERQSLVLDYAIRPVLSYLHALTMPNRRVRRDLRLGGLRGRPAVTSNAGSRRPRRCFDVIAVAHECSP